MSRALVNRLRESRFRGNLSVKQQSASLSPEDTFRIVTKGPRMTVPEQLLALAQLANVSSPSLTAVKVMANRAAASSEQFYPPQIVESLTTFGKIGFSDSDALLRLFESRMDDVLNEASPKRMVQLIEAFANLEIPIASVWPEIRVALIRVIPQLKRGIPSVLKSLASMGCADIELAHALLVQAECLLGETEASYFVQSIEAASRVDGMESAVAQALEVVSSSGHKATSVQAVSLLTAALRVGHESARAFQNQLNQALLSDSEAYAQSRLLVAMGRHGLSTAHVGEVIERNMNDADFSQRMLPFVVYAGSLIGGADDVLRLVIHKQLDKADRLSAEKLVDLTRAAVISGADASVTDELKALLRPVGRQLSIRQQRLLWEVVPDSTPVACPGTVAEAVGPYSVRRVDDSTVSLRIPRYAVFRPGSTEIQRAIQLRVNAIQASCGSQVVFSHSS